jgi:cell division protein FtsZ
MNTELQSGTLVEAPIRSVTMRVFGVGTAGMNVMERLMGGGLSGVGFVAVGTDAAALDKSSAADKLLFETKPLRGLGTGGDPERGHALAEENYARLRELCEGVDTVFIVAGMGGGAGTGISPVLARAAKEAGALVLGFVTRPFDCEGTRRHRLAEQGLGALRSVADGVVCLPNQKILKIVDENTSLVETFRAANEYLSDGVRGFWRLLTQRGLIEIHFEDVCSLIRDRHGESAFAVAEAMGATRSREVTDKLLAHPMLDGGKVLGAADAVLLSLVGGPDLTMAEVNRVVQDIGVHCENAQVIMGAAIDESYGDRLALTLIATPRNSGPTGLAARGITESEDLATQLLERSATARPGSRFVPPPPSLPPEQVKQLLARQKGGNPGSRKGSLKMRQGQLALEIVNKGRFEKSEPTIHKGEDLDVPTYIRRGVCLN